ncbi:MAG: hypothetical protein AAGE94_22800, partial [Acidobacteriota bacterium]
MVTKSTRPHPFRPSIAVVAWCLVTMVVAPAPSALAQPKAVDLPTLKRAINTQVRAAKRVAPDTGVHVVALDGEEIYGYSADTSRILASNTKLFTTALAFHHLETLQERAPYLATR